MATGSPIPPDLARYHRQMLLPGIGEEGQRRLQAAHAVIVGCGALGCTIADLLARAGVGTLTLIDRDVVELTNLQRQTLFTEQDAAESAPKAQAARHRLAQINSAITIHPLVHDLTHKNAERLLIPPPPRPAGEVSRGSASDGGGAVRPIPHSSHPITVSPSHPLIFLDGTDNFQTRYLLNDLAVKHSIPYIYGGAVGTSGMTMPILPGHTPCLRCIFDQPPPPGASATCDTAGVLGPLISIVAALQSAAAIRLLVGAPAPDPVLTEVDAWDARFRRIDLDSARRPDCPCCGQHRFDFLSGELAEETTTLCGREAIQVSPADADATIDLQALAAKLAPHGVFTLTPFHLRGTLERERGEMKRPIELTIFPDARAVVRHTANPNLARTIYAKYIGA
jgi:molybdopterin/thiamine biosynthesis adenylyltransferase